MKIAYCSDLHNEHLDLPIQIPPGTDLLVLAGDIHSDVQAIEYGAQYLDRVRFVLVVAGNHEFYNRYGVSIAEFRDRMSRRAAELGVMFGDDKVFDLDGFKVGAATLWTDFALDGDVTLSRYRAARMMNDYRYIFRAPSYPIEPTDTISMHENSVNLIGLAIDAGADLIVTHHAPHRHSSGGHGSDVLTPAYCSDLSRLFPDRPLTWIHGHTHYPVDYCVGQTRVVSNPRGYPGELRHGSGFRLKTLDLVDRQPVV